MLSDQLTKDKIATRLPRLTKNFLFRSGSPAHCSDDVVDISLYVVPDDDVDFECMLCVFESCWSGPAVRAHPWVVRKLDSGRIVRAGCTDRRGQSRLKHLDEGEYALEMEGLACGPLVEKLEPCKEADNLRPESGDAKISARFAAA